MKALLAAIAVLLTAVVPAAAQELTLQADTSRRGHIALDLTGPPGAVVRVAEGARRIARVTLDAAGAARVENAAEWRCDRRTRRLRATGDGLEGSVLVTTPSCRDRYVLRAKRRVRATKPLVVRVRDSFGLGGSPARVCARAQGARVCAPVRGRKARFELPRAARWRLTARRSEPTHVRARPAPGPLTVLATGDSMIQYVDFELDDRLPRHRVVSDAHISTGLSKPFMFNWPAHARKQVRRLHPEVTVMFIGANDGFPFGDTACCGGAWRRAYARRVRDMIRTYRQRGAGRVYWCLLPAPRGGDFRRVFVAVNAAIRRAARKEPGIRVVDLPATFTPGYAFRQSITYEGRTVSVRQDDGVHLNPAGAAIAADLIVERMRRDGVR